MVKHSERIQFFYLLIPLLCGSWEHQRILSNKPFWKYDSWFSFEVTKLTSVFYPWNDSFLGMKKNNLTTNNVIAFDSIKIQTQ